MAGKLQSLPPERSHPHATQLLPVFLQNLSGNPNKVKNLLSTLMSHSPISEFALYLCKSQEPCMLLPTEVQTELTLDTTYNCTAFHMLLSQYPDSIQAAVNLVCKAMFLNRCKVAGAVILMQILGVSILVATLFIKPRMNDTTFLGAALYLQILFFSVYLM